MIRIRKRSCRRGRWWTCTAATAFSKSFQLFAGIDNLLDRTYYTYGTFTQLDGLPPNFNLTNPRTYSPSPPRTYFLGVKVTL